MADKTSKSDNFEKYFVPAAAADPFASGFVETADKQDDPFASSFVPASAPQLSGAAAEGGKIIPARVSDSEVAAIAREHGVDAAALGGLVAWHGGLKEKLDWKEIAKFAAGEVVGEALGMGLPQFVHKKLQDPKMQYAIDDLSTLIGEKKSTLQSAGEIVGGVAAGIGLAKGIGALGKGAIKAHSVLAAAPVSGAASGLAHSRTGEELQGAGIGGAIGAGVAGLGTAAGALIRKTAPKLGSKDLVAQVEKQLVGDKPRNDLLEDLLVRKTDPASLDFKQYELVIGTEKAQEILNRAAKKNLDQTTVHQLLTVEAENVLNKTRLELHGGLTQYAKENRLKFADKIEEDLGPERMQQKFQQWTENKAVREIGAAEADNAAKVSTLEKRAWFPSSPGVVLDRADELAGTKLAVEQVEASARQEEYAGAAATLLKNLKKEVGIPDQAEAGAIIRNIESGNKGGKKEQAFTQFFDQMHEILNKGFGFRVGKIEDYAPHMMLPADELKEAAYKLWQKTPTDKSLVQQLRRWTEHDIQTRADVDAAMDIFLRLKDEDLAQNMRAASSNTRLAGATKKREGTMPEWAMDRDLNRVANRYVQGLERNVVLQNYLPELEKAITYFDASGDKHMASYLTDLQQSILNPSDSIGAEVTKFARKKVDDWKTWLGLGDKEVPKITGDINIDKKIWEKKPDTIKAIGEWMNNRTYAVGIGWNVPSVLQSAVSPFTAAVPELGADKAASLVTSAMIDALKVARDGVEIKLGSQAAALLKKPVGSTVKTHNPNMVAYNEGLMGEKWRGEMLDEGFRKTQLSKTAEAFKGVEGMGMALFNMAEKSSRTTVAFMAKRLADQMIADPKLVQQVVRSPAYQRRLGENLSRLRGSTGTEEMDLKRQFNTDVMRYLNSRTLLNYDNLNRSQFARTFGPMLSQYTRLPSYAYGRTLQSFQQRGAGKGALDSLGAYGLPAMGYYLLDKLMDTESSPRLKRILGRDGYSGWNISQSIDPLIESRGGIISTPIVRLLGTAATRGNRIRKHLGESVGLSSGDKELEGSAAEEFAGIIADTFSNFGPGAGMLRFFGDDVPLYLSGEKPEIDKGEPKLFRQLRSVAGQQ